VEKEAKQSKTKQNLMNIYCTIQYSNEEYQGDQPRPDETRRDETIRYNTSPTTTGTVPYGRKTQTSPGGTVTVQYWLYNTYHNPPYKYLIQSSIINHQSSIITTTTTESARRKKGLDSRSPRAFSHSYHIFPITCFHQNDMRSLLLLGGGRGIMRLFGPPFPFPIRIISYCALCPRRCNLYLRRVRDGMVWSD